MKRLSIKPRRTWLEGWDITEAAYVTSLCQLNKTNPPKKNCKGWHNRSSGCHLSPLRRTCGPQGQQTERKRRECPSPRAIWRSKNHRHLNEFQPAANVIAESTGPVRFPCLSRAQPREGEIQTGGGGLVSQRNMNGLICER
jgi:hypothetical protein